MRIICQSVFDIFLVVLFSETYVMFCFATYTTIICMNIAILLRKFLKTLKIVSLKCAFPTQFNIFFYPPIVPTVVVCPLDTSWNRRMKLCCWCAAFTFTFQTSLARGGGTQFEPILTGRSPPFQIVCSAFQWAPTHLCVMICCCSVNSLLTQKQYLPPRSANQDSLC